MKALRAQKFIQCHHTGANDRTGEAVLQLHIISINRSHGLLVVVDGYID